MVLQFRNVHLRCYNADAMQQNTPEFLVAVVRALEAAHIKTWLFGGWAEELSGLRPPGPHRDIDLLYPSATFTRLDTFLQTNEGAEEIKAKRFAHKRALRWDGVLVEIFLLCPEAGGYVTHFFGFHRFPWPEDTLLESVPLLGERIASASPSALTLYRQEHGAVAEAYQLYMSRTQQ